MEKITEQLHCWSVDNLGGGRADIHAATIVA